eukprot:jgi/Chrzof1/456/Cz01g16150.t1
MLTRSYRHCHLQPSLCILDFLPDSQTQYRGSTTRSQVPCGCLGPWHFTARSITSQNNLDSNPGTQVLLEGLHAIKLRDDLTLKAEQQPYLSYSELLNFIKKNGDVTSDKEAEDMANALMRTGNLLYFNGVVYLNPHEVAEVVLRALPADAIRAQKRLNEVETELKDMEHQYQQIQQAARRWPRFWLNVGCGAVFTQLVGFAYLIWWELSWDVMEPIAYMVGLTYSFMAYLYFLGTKGKTQFDYGAFNEYWTEQQLEKKMNEKGFNLDRFRHLVRSREMYTRYVTAQAEQVKRASDANAGAAP